MTASARPRRGRLMVALGLAVAVAACGGQPPRPTADRGAGPGQAARPTAEGPPRAAADKPVAGLRKGGYYQDDGPGDNPPPNLGRVPEPQPRWEPLHRFANKPYVVLGREYVPNQTVQPYRARGIASWYGRKFHGQRTSIGDPYDMYAMTAAHPTLALPSYARVTNPANGRSVVVRVVDRGPFHADRIIDLSYTAAWKLGIVGNGSGLVEVEAIIPGEPTGMTYAQTGADRTSPTPERDEIAELAMRLEAADAPPPPTANGSPHGLYLQLGAFGSPDNAENLKARLARELDWLGEDLQITSAGGIHRVQLGPYANRPDADRVAERIRIALGYKPTVVQR